MTISSASRKSGPYSCNGSTTQFPFDFKVFAASDVVAVLTDQYGLETTLTSGYTVSLNANQDSNPGGTITTTATYATGYLVTLTSAVQNLQSVDLTNQGGFYPKVLNTALDRLTVMVQQVAEQVGRAVKVGISSATMPDQLISQLYTAVTNAMGYANSASSSATASGNSATAAASSAAEAAQSAMDAGNTPVAVPTHAATSKATPVDADEIPLIDSAAAWVLKKITWDNLKATLKAYFDTLYTSGKQIQPITASVASNALTLTLNATTLDFRSSILSSGAVNTRNVSSQISVVVPSGATLGTTNGKSARLALLAIDNGGTVEAAVVNISGGVNLDETTLISTTAISAASTSASEIYSTSYRTSVPFRVVGFIDITEATAGTWASAPTTIQGVGGQAITALSSLGYGQVWQDVSASRSIGTTYYNATGKPIVVSADITGSAAAQCSATLTIGGVIAVQAVTSESNGSTFNGVGTPFSAIVPPGASYVIANNTNTNVITRWAELR